MSSILDTYVRWVDALNEALGRIVMYVLFFALLGIFLYSIIAGPVFDRYPVWITEMGQFVMTAYYLLGGGYSLKHDAHVRMDVLYGSWSKRKQAIADSLTGVLMMVFLVVLLIGGISSAGYAIETGQQNYTAWAPPMAPIKVIMVVGIFLMILQTSALLIRDIRTVCGGVSE